MNYRGNYSNYWCKNNSGNCHGGGSDICQEYTELKAKYRCLCLKAAQLLQERNEKKLGKQASGDEDAVFLRGLYPFINTLSTQKKLNLRMAFQELMYKYAYNDQLNANQMLPAAESTRSSKDGGKGIDPTISQSEEEDFYESMLPYFKSLTPEKKLLFRNDITEELFTRIFGSPTVVSQTRSRPEKRKDKKSEHDSKGNKSTSKDKKSPKGSKGKVASETKIEQENSKAKGDFGREKSKSEQKNAKRKGKSVEKSKKKERSNSPQAKGNQTENVVDNNKQRNAKKTDNNKQKGRSKSSQAKGNQNENEMDNNKQTNTEKMDSNKPTNTKKTDNNKLMNANKQKTTGREERKSQKGADKKGSNKSSKKEKGNEDDLEESKNADETTNAPFKNVKNKTNIQHMDGDLVNKTNTQNTDRDLRNKRSRSKPKPSGKSKKETKRPMKINNDLAETFEEEDSLVKVYSSIASANNAEYEAVGLVFPDGARIPEESEPNDQTDTEYYMQENNLENYGEGEFLQQNEPAPNETARKKPLHIEPVRKELISYEPLHDEPVELDSAKLLKKKSSHLLSHERTHTQYMGQEFPDPKNRH